MSVLGLLHGITVGLLLAGAAMALEAVLSWHRRPTRAVWIAALAGTLSAPVWGPWVGGPGVPALSPMGAESTPTTALSTPEAVRTAPTAVAVWRARLSRPEPWLGLLWAGSAATALLLIGGGILTLHRRVSRWPLARIGGEGVVLSPDFGPASVGLVTPRTVLPRWALGLDASELELVLRHERAHAHAHDPLLLALALAGSALAPWNLAVWWQVARLRRAVELDCDRRVLADGASAADYGRLLVAVGRRLPQRAFPAAALVETTSFLERRLTLMRTSTRPRVRRTALALALAAGSVVLACEAPAPTQITEAVLPSANAEQLASVIGTIPPDARVVVDGVILRDGLASDVLAQLPPEEILSVEILKKGAAAFEDGPTPARPVISIITRKGAEASRFQVRKADPKVAWELPQPVVVVDGVITELQLVDIKGLDVKSIKIVKGAAALALYGERARGGVVHVTTKDGGGSAGS